MSDVPKFEILDLGDGGLVCDVDTGICTPEASESQDPAGEQD